MALTAAAFAYANHPMITAAYIHVVTGFIGFLIVYRTERKSFRDIPWILLFLLFSLLMGTGLTGILSFIPRRGKKNNRNHPVTA